MSLIYHPDKIRPDPAKNETVEMLNERFDTDAKALLAVGVAKLEVVVSHLLISESFIGLGKLHKVEMLNERFVELTKAYKALTDEEVRNNYLQFGHPDGTYFPLPSITMNLGRAIPMLKLCLPSGWPNWR
jgi:translocation protein SEC63